MPIRLTPDEKKTLRKLAALKKRAGSHSPSPATLKDAGVSVAHDFCYLSNPYATELFLRHFRRDMAAGDRLRNLVERYPSQNRSLAVKAAGYAGVEADRIFVGNGASEIIQAVLREFAKRKILVPVPTFSPYLEFAPRGAHIVMHQLKKEDGFRLSPDAFLAQIAKEKPDTVVVINPNNPDGGFLDSSEIRVLLRGLRGVPTVIIDESFIHFSARKIESACKYAKEYPNLILIKSLSKDFGVAGLRLGYAVMAPERVSHLLAQGYLWNVSGFGEYFLSLLGQRRFLKAYERARQRAVRERDDFYRALSAIGGLKVYPSKANCFLTELRGGRKATELTAALLLRDGIYIRPCKDKVGLTGEFVRIASRGKKENDLLVRALRDAMGA